jgi:tetratricopeptide (TPR) repeat protein
LSNYNRKVKDRDYDKVISFVENIKDEDVIINGGCYAVLSFSYYGKKDYDNALKYYVKFFRTDCAEEFLIKNKKELKKYYKRLIKKFPSNSELEEIANRYAKYLKDD